MRTFGSCTHLVRDFGPQSAADVSGLAMIVDHQPAKLLVYAVLPLQDSGPRVIGVRRWPSLPRLYTRRALAMAAARSNTFRSIWASTNEATHL